jgi:hypothetical protein
MSRFSRSALLLATLVVTVSGCYQGGDLPTKPLAPRPSGIMKEGIGERFMAMEIVGEDADGQSFRLSDYRGKVVLLDFWAEW